MTVKKRVVHDQDNLVRLVRRLDKSVNEADWGQLKHVRKLLGTVELDNEVRPSLNAQKALEVPCGRLWPAGQADASMLPVNEEELAAQLVLQLWRNTEHFSGELAAVLRPAEEMGADLDVMKRERERLRDHRGKALGTTCLAISSVVIVAITFLSMFVVIRFT
ncbi:hypothetical protein EDB92DRAFT_1818684 [Lactarius akahatsu]|uniref:Uncharacterized protein n=1 Tax=Lactarius akahatsu TaxID=416441 RepID=A0AAD4QAQ5_9AGAM|nr:hypothetical protein EDB92DRAFT_1818684 [Lactarius akahatsu]